eukprot:SAG11_NODE_288_length_11198_cov_29.339130_3_plen_397_part_00
MLTLLALYLFLPTATLGKRAVYTPGQDMRWIPLWVRVDLFARSILLLFVIHWDSTREQAIIFNALGLLIHLGVLWCNHIMRPCCVFWVNWFKMVSVLLHRPIMCNHISIITCSLPRSCLVLFHPSSHSTRCESLSAPFVVLACARQVIHSCAVWSTAVAIGIISFDMRSASLVGVLLITGWLLVLLGFRINQRHFILIEHAMRTTDRFPADMKLACIQRIGMLEELLTRDRAAHRVAQWSHHSLILELICFCAEVNHKEIMARAFEAMARISVHSNAVAFMERCPIKSTVQLLSTAIKPQQHPFRRLVNTLKLLERDLGGGDFNHALERLLGVVDNRMRDCEALLPPSLQRPLAKWATAEVRQSEEFLNFLDLCQYQCRCPIAYWWLTLLVAHFFS